MEANNKLDMDAPNLLNANAKAVEKAFKKAVKAALLKHKQSNNPVAIWRGGKVVLIEASKLLPEKK